MSAPYIFIAGAANVDVIATIASEGRQNNHRGSVSIEFGGCAYNMALNLAVLGAGVTFMTAQNDGPFAQMIRAEMRQRSIRPYVQLVQDLPDSVFVGTFQASHMTTSVLSETLFRVDFEESFLEKGVREAKAVIATAELSPATLQRLVQVANRLHVPVYIAGCSAEEVGRLNNVKGVIDLIFLNEKEAADDAVALLGTPDLNQLAARRACTLIVTQGARGASIITPEGSTKIPMPKTSVTGNTLGAGDFLMASTVHQLTLGHPLAEAIGETFKLMPKVLSHKHANIADDNVIRSNIGQVYNQAHLDNLTGVLNRHGFQNYLSQLTEDEAATAFVALLDADYFKSVNDTYGHDVGDEVLQLIAKTVKSNLRQGDMVGRWGGEEFICLLKARDMADAMDSLNRVRQALEKTPVPGMGGKYITLSGGVARYHPQGDAAHSLKLADQALYQAKEQGRNRIVAQG